ncbi:MAG: LysR family transcriptional regulator [Myxococcota bacterium]
MHDWDDYRVLLAVSRAGTLTGAAEALGVSQTTVTRRLRKFAEVRGTALFGRLRGGVELTPAGEAHRETAEAMERALLELERRVAGGHLDLVGRVVLTLPELIATAWVDRLAAFGRAYPRLSLEVVAADSLRSLHRREADVAVRLTRQAAEHLVGRRVGYLAMAAYASASVAQQGLEGLPWVCWTSEFETASVMDQARRQLAPSAPVILRANAHILQLEAARRGEVVAYLPCLIAERWPDLVRVSEPRTFPQSMWVLTHPDLRRNPRVRALMSWMVDTALSDPHTPSDPP